MTSRLASLARPLARPASIVDPRLVAVGAGIAAANALVAIVVGTGKPGLGLLLAALPILVGGAAWLAIVHRNALLFVPLAFAVLGEPIQRLPGTGHTSVYPADLMVALAFGGWLVTRLISPPTERTRWPRSVVLSWPFVLFAAAVLLGVVRGHARWGEHYLSEPTRLLLYVAIAGAVAGLTPAVAYRGLVAVFYGGAVFQCLWGLYYLVSGRSQTLSATVSTGGTRALSLSAAMYLAGALVLALLNVELDRNGRRPLFHLGMAALSTFGITISLGRTTFAAIGVLVPVLFLVLRRARRVLLSFVPLLVPVAVLLVLLVLQIHPSFGAAFTNRLTGKLSNDASVITRQHETQAMLQGVGKEPVLGVGFGRPVEYVPGGGGGAVRATGDLENGYIWLLAGGGALALTTLIVLILAYYGDALRRLRGAERESRALIIFAMSMAFVFLVNATTGPILSDPNFALTVWIMLLLPAVVQKPPMR